MGKRERECRAVWGGLRGGSVLQQPIWLAAKMLHHIVARTPLPPPLFCLFAGLPNDPNGKEFKICIFVWAAARYLHPRYVP